MAITERLAEIPVISAIAVVIDTIKAAMNGIDVNSMIAREAGAFLPALA